jgi:1,4-dihydroxy-2-naphthoyl-CoA hydrolase
MIWYGTIDHKSIKRMGENNLSAHLGIEFTEIGDNYIKATMPVDHRTKQPYGLLHGGASVALAETVGSYASHLVVDASKFQTVGIEINANHIRKVSSGIVTACAKPIHLGKTTHVWSIEITDESSNLVCISRLTVAVIPKKD